MIIRSFSDGFSVTDWTQELNVVPNEWGTIGQLGLFQDNSVAENTVTFEEISQDGALIVDQVRGNRANVNKDMTRKVHTFAVPHFPIDDAIYPGDIQGKRAYGIPSEAENVEAVRARKMVQLARRHAWTLEAARAQLITAGTVYAPNGTVSQNWYSEFSKSQASGDFVLGTSTTDIVGKIETGIATIQDNLSNGQVVSGIVVLTGTTFFSRLIAHATVKTAYQYYTSTQEPLRNRLSANGGSNTVRRMFDFAGVRFVEMRDSYNGTALIPATEAYMVAQGTDAFRTYFAPAQRFGLVNTLGEKMYLFEMADPSGTEITLQSESNFVNALMRPDAVFKCYTSN